MATRRQYGHITTAAQLLREDAQRLGTFAGMETAVTEQSEAAALYSAEELTARLLEPRKSIDGKTQAIENDSPLFFGVINPTLFN